jgi:hypothetical protein
VLGTAFIGISREADGQDKIDQLHFGTYRRRRPSGSARSLRASLDSGFPAGARAETDGKRLRARFGEVNNMAGGSGAAFRS